MNEKGSDSERIRQIALLEAGLYVTGRPLTPKTLGSLVGLRSAQKVIDLLRELIKQYDSQSSALQVLELKDGRFIMQLRPEFSGPVKKLVTRKLLTKGPLKTLSFIAFKQPITQAYVSKVRGKPAYYHIRQLREMGLISEERLGKTSIIRTTDTFADYFNLSHNIKVMKQQLETLFRDQRELEESEKRV